MNALLIVARGVHFGSALLLFGGLVFALLVAPAWRTGELASRENRDPARAWRRVGWWSLAASAVSGIAWLVAEASTMSGLPIVQAANSDALALVLRATVFGRVWTLRLGLLGVLGVLLALTRAARPQRAAHLTLAASAVAGAHLGALAWFGHAAAGEGPARYVQLGSDVAHLLAAGAWLGALPGLVFVLGHRVAPAILLSMTRRFSALGLLSVSAILASGLVNAWYLVGDLPALFGTGYGQLLLIKLALFAFMVVLASVNRLALTPRLGADHLALGVLRRNAILETAAGIAIVGTVAVLGVTVPAAHQSPVWPFAETLSWEPAGDSPAVRAGLISASVFAAVGAALALRSARRRRLRALIAGVGMVVLAGVGSGWLLAVPAFPTTYAAPAVPYDVRSIAAGATLYAENCSACHGAEGRGDGPLAASLPVKPIDLIEHAAHHPPGNLFWWIGHGISETPMPAFAPRLGDAEIWDLVVLLQARADAWEARTMSGDAQASPRVAAPDFTFERAGQAQEALRGQREERVTLLVFYTLPESLPRLRALAANQAAFAAAGARIIALPLRAPATAADLESGAAGGDSILATAAPDVAGVYSLLARRDSTAGAPGFTHAEYLVDRGGDLRARWIGASTAAPEQTAQLLTQIERLAHETPRARARPAHRH